MDIQDFSVAGNRRQAYRLAGLFLAALLATSLLHAQAPAQPAPARRVQGDEQLRPLRNLVW